MGYGAEAFLLGVHLFPLVEAYGKRGSAFVILFKNAAHNGVLNNCSLRESQDEPGAVNLQGSTGIFIAPDDSMNPGLTNLEGSNSRSWLSRL